MAGYVLTGITILHPEAYEYYQRQVPAVIVKYGSRYLVRGSRTARILLPGRGFQ